MGGMGFGGPGQVPALGVLPAAPSGNPVQDMETFQAREESFHLQRTCAFFTRVAFRSQRMHGLQTEQLKQIYLKFKEVDKDQTGTVRYNTPCSLPELNPTA